MDNLLTLLKDGALVLLAFACILTLISVIGKIFNQNHRIDMDFCIGLPAFMAGYHALSHSASHQYLELWKFPNIPKLLNNDWLHFGIVFVILFLTVLLIEVLANAVTKNTKQNVLQDLEKP